MNWIYYCLLYTQDVHPRNGSRTMLIEGICINGPINFVEIIPLADRDRYANLRDGLGDSRNQERQSSKNERSKTHFDQRKDWI